MLTPGEETATARTIRLIREDQTRRIVEWLRGRTGAHGGAFTSANEVVDAIQTEFGTDERETT